MSLRGTPTKLVTNSLLVSMIICWPVFASAQVESATWEEMVGWNSGTGLTKIYGQDSSEPEAISIDENGAGWSADAAVSFPGTGPPRAKVDSHIWHSPNEMEMVEAHSRISIMFGFEVVQTADPGVAVISIPVLVQAEGSVSILPDGGGGMGHVIFDLVSTEHLGIGYAEITEFSETDPVNEPFLYFVRAHAILGEIFHIGLLAETNAYSQAPIVNDNAQVSAEIMIPAFVIEDTIIPGTANSRFPDYFEIVFGDGYYSLGVPTSEEKMSWGDVKALFR